MQARTQKLPVSAPPPPRVWTSLDLIKWTTGYFQKKGIESPRLTAELLLADVLNCPRIRLYVDFEKPVPPEKLAQYREYVRRRADSHEPLQYIVGHAQFVDLQLRVTPAVLIPRPETEILALWAVERVKEFAAQRSGNDAPRQHQDPGSNSQEPETRSQEPVASSNTTVRVVDLCTGSGCLALYVAAKEPRAEVLATDISAAALAVAAENARTLHLEGSVTFREGDLFDALPHEAQGSFDLLLTNPPYVDPEARATLTPEVREHEPAVALYASSGGLDIVGRIVGSAGVWLRSGGWLGLELGLGQADEVRKSAEDSGAFSAVELRTDQAGIPRFLLARRSCDTTSGALGHA